MDSKRFVYLSSPDFPTTYSSSSDLQILTFSEMAEVFNTIYGCWLPQARKKFKDVGAFYIGVYIDNTLQDVIKLDFDDQAATIEKLMQW